MDQASIVIAISLLVSILLFVSSFFLKKIFRVGMFLGTLLLSVTLGYALIENVSYKECAAVILLLFFVAVAVRRKR